MLDSLQNLAKLMDQKVLFLCIGEQGKLIESPNFSCRFFEHVNEVRVLNELYNCSDYYLHMAKADTFPNTVLEAQSCGIPVLVNPVCGIPEQIQKDKTGWFLKSSKPSEVAETILKRVSNCNYEQMRNDCRNLAVNYFSAERMISKYREYYYDILRNHSNPPIN